MGDRLVKFTRSQWKRLLAETERMRVQLRRLAQHVRDDDHDPRRLGELVGELVADGARARRRRDVKKPSSD